MSTLRGRDVEGILRTRGMDKGTAYILVWLVEQNNQQTKDMKELALYFDKMVDSLKGVIGVAENMKAAVDVLKAEEPNV